MRLFLCFVVFINSCLCSSFFGSIFGSPTVNIENDGRPTNGSREDNSNKVANSECTNNKVEPRIAWAVVGGSRIRNQLSVPYMAALGVRQKGSMRWFCGGSLISAKVVLTAAHCFATNGVDMVRLGATYLSEDDSHHEFEVDSFKMHPQYKYPASYHDIGVVLLSTSVDARGVRPVCLPMDLIDGQRGDEASVMGWGAESVGGEGKQELRQVKLKIFSNEECDRAYSNSSLRPKNFPRGISDEQLCAGSPSGGKDACQGDSGGPLVLQDRNGVIRQIGIVSTGSGCGSRAYPGVYVRVSKYQQWINGFI